LRTYVEMLQFQDRLHSHAYFRKAAAGAIRWMFVVFNLIGLLYELFYTLVSVMCIHLYS
jgi:hypothetical protein